MIPVKIRCRAKNALQNLHILDKFLNSFTASLRCSKLSSICLITLKFTNKVTQAFKRLVMCVQKSSHNRPKDSRKEEQENDLNNTD